MKTVLRVTGFAAPTLMLLLVYAGDTFRQSVVSMLIFLALAALLTAMALQSDAQTPTTPDDRGFAAKGATAWWLRGAGLIGLGMLALLVSGRRYQGMIIFPSDIRGFYPAVIGAAACLSWLVVKPPKPVISLAVLLIAALAVRMLWFSTWEINPAKRDMLALVVSAVERFLSFENPYGFHQMQRGSSVPLTYPPGLWLMHLPAYLVGLDIRWTAWLADAVIIGGLGAYAVRRSRACVGPVFIALSVYAFLPDIHWNGIYAEPHADFAVLTLLILSALLGRPLASGALFGLALSTRPFNLVLLPFFAVWLYRRFGLRKTWQAFVVAGAVAAALYLPFVCWDPDAFYAGTVRWLLAYGPAHSGWFHAKMSFSGILYQTHLEGLMAPTQIATLLIAAIVAARRLKTTRHLVAFWMISYALFVSFNAIVWMSFWIGVCLLAVALLAASGDPETSQRLASERIAPPRFGKIDLGVMIGLSVGIAAALAVMLSSLYVHFDDDNGREETWAYLDAAVKDGDFVLDASGYRAAILKTPYLLSRADLPDRAVLGATPFQAVLPARRFDNSLDHRRIFAVSRFALFGAQQSLYLGAGGTGPFDRASTKRFGRYTVHELVKKAGVSEVGTLSKAPADLTVEGVWTGGGRTAVFKRRDFDFGRAANGARMLVQPCRIDNTTTPMLALVPRAAVTYRVTAATDADWVAVFGGLPDRNAAWRQAPIDVRVIAGSGREIGAYRFLNQSGMHGTTFKLPSDSRETTLEFRTYPNENPKLCFDAVFFKTR